jgi:molybdate-binding protein
MRGVRSTGASGFVLAGRCRVAAGCCIDKNLGQRPMLATRRARPKQSEQRGGRQRPFARALLRGRRPAIIHLWREQGWLTPAGNPDHITDPADLRVLRIARRPFGTGTRVLLDRLLTEAGIAPASVTGPEAASHLEVAMSVASGQAHTGLGVRAAATALDLGFVPVAWEDFDIVLSGDTLPAAEPLIAALRTPAVQSSIDALSGYDLSRAGSVELLA